jgi:ferredoxin
VTDEQSPRVDRRSSDRLTVQVDRALCSGTGQCSERAPTVFELRDNKAWVRDPSGWGELDDEEMRDVAAGCPWFAISVES